MTETVGDMTEALAFWGRVREVLRNSNPGLEEPLAGFEGPGFGPPSAFWKMFRQLLPPTLRGFVFLLFHLPGAGLSQDTWSWGQGVEALSIMDWGGKALSDIQWTCHLPLEGLV